MRLFSRAKDGGPKSTVTGYWLIELKKLFSIVLLKFEDGSRDEFHSHAFHSINFILKGKVIEEFIHGWVSRGPIRRFWPILTKRSRFHRVRSDGTTWVLSFRGPWKDTWREYDPKTDEFVTLTHGRKRVSTDEHLPQG
jgi:hypothetical protein